jgi:peroxiredoxin
MLRYVIIVAIILALVIVLSQAARQLAFPGNIYGTGERVGDFTTTDLDGKPARFSDHQGKVILLNFFANWCAPCNDEAPYLKDLHQNYKDRGFQVIGILHDDTVEAAKNFRERHQVTYPLWVKPKGDAQKRMKPSNLPYNVLINRKGVVVYSLSGYVPDILEKHVRKLMDTPS